MKESSSTRGAIIHLHVSWVTQWFLGLDTQVKKGCLLIHFQILRRVAWVFPFCSPKPIKPSAEKNTRKWGNHTRVTIIHWKTWDRWAMETSLKAVSIANRNVWICYNKSWTKCVVTTVYSSIMFFLWKTENLFKIHYISLTTYVSTKKGHYVLTLHLVNNLALLSPYNSGSICRKLQESYNIG